MIVSIARQYYANAFGNERLGIYAAVATPAVLVQAAARFLYAPALVPLTERWNSSPQKAFLPAFKKTIRVMLVAMAVAIPLLALIGPWALSVVYGQKVEGYTYLFTNVLISTGSIALLYYLTDVLVLVRDIKGSLISTTAALIASAALMMPLESLFDMQGINYTIIIASVIGIIISIIRLMKDIAGASPKL